VLDDVKHLPSTIRDMHACPELECCAVVLLISVKVLNQATKRDKADIALPVMCPILCPLSQAWRVPTFLVHLIGLKLQTYPLIPWELAPDCLGKGVSSLAMQLRLRVVRVQGNFPVYSGTLCHRCSADIPLSFPLSSFIPGLEPQAHE
jgi:hypothetical protein